MVETAITVYGFCGIKVHRRDARITREVCNAARLFSVPIIYDVMGEISSIELLASEYPDVYFVIPHLGSFSDDWRAQQSFIDHLVRHPNIYTDTSGVRNYDLLEQAVARAGARKILFGSDGPWLHPGIELAKVCSLPLNKLERQAVLAGNFKRLTSRRRKLPTAEFSQLSRLNMKRVCKEGS
jgi:predicted TIM-barrel fold metal-dependent hydrolase